MVEQFRTFGLSQTDSQEGEHAHTRQNASTQLQDLGTKQQAEHAETRAIQNNHLILRSVTNSVTHTLPLP